MIETKTKIKAKEWDVGPELTDKVHKHLRKDLCVVRFLKADGTKREMLCTLHESFLPPRDPNVVPTARVATEKQMRQVMVWDVEAEGWRSFTLDRLLRLSVVI